MITRKKILVYLFSISLAYPLLLTNVISQEKRSEDRKPITPESYDENDTQPFENPKSPVNCELAGRYIDDAIRRVAKNHGNLFFIVRLGEGELSAKLVNLRLRQVKAYMYNYNKVKTVFAVGEKTSGNGVLEIYVKGELLYTLPLFKNKGLNLLECIAV